VNVLSIYLNKSWFCLIDRLGDLLPNRYSKYLVVPQLSFNSFLLQELLCPLSGIHYETRRLVGLHSAAVHTLPQYLAEVWHYHLDPEPDSGVIWRMTI